MNRMKTKLVVLSTIIASLAAFTYSAAVASGNASKKGDPASIYEFTMKNIDGKQVSLSDFRGHVVLIVNVASRCGFTPQYEALEKIYQKYQSQGFVILGFPANNFMSQEPGTDEEIKTFCSARYNVTFPMFSKISVKGSDMSPLYKYLTDKSSDPDFGGDIKWNFNKFLLDKNGKIVARFEPPVKPDSDQVVQAIEKALGQ